MNSTPQIPPPNLEVLLEQRRSSVRVWLVLAAALGATAEIALQTLELEALRSVEGHA
jgi:hypothetical protein